MTDFFDKLIEQEPYTQYTLDMLYIDSKK